MAEDLIGVHTSRAMAELDLARAAASPDAAQAHLALSGLHLSKARALLGAASRAGTGPDMPRLDEPTSRPAQ